MDHRLQVRMEGRQSHWDKKIECEGGGGRDREGPLHMSRLEMMMAWRRTGESWMDSGGHEEGEGESCPVRRSLPAGWALIPLRSCSPCGRKRRAGKDNPCSLDMFRLSHQGCVWPLIAGTTHLLQPVSVLTPILTPVSHDPELVAVLQTY